jgi:hypothetical protein
VFFEEVYATGWQRVESINGEHEMSASAGGNILGEIGKFINI